MISISIIIPVYNGATYIERCLNSIIHSGLRNDEYEIIIVDDCSTDDTVRVIKSWQNKLANLVLLRHEENRRQGAARNSGLTVARGEFVYFADIDDTLGPKFKEAVDFSTSTTKEVDIICGEVSIQNGPGGPFVQQSTNIPSRSIMDSIQFCETVYGAIYLPGAPWLYLFRREFLQTHKLFFMENVLFEDTDWVEKTLFTARKIAYLQIPIYYYHINSGSTCNIFEAKVESFKILLCKRRLVFAEAVEHTHTNFSSMIKERSMTWIDDIVSLRHLSRFSPRHIFQIKKYVGRNALNYLGGYSSTWFQSFFFSQTWLCCIFICLCYPCTLMGRYFVRLIRSI